MTYWLSNLILAKDNGIGWEDFGFLIFIAIIFIFKNVGNIIKAIKENAEKKDQLQRPKSFDEPQKRRYTPLDQQGRPIRQAGRKQPEIVLVEPVRAEETGPLPPANAKIMPPHDHSKELAAMKRYKEKIAKQKALRDQKQRLAQQIRQKKVKPQRKPTPARIPEHKIIPVSETIQPSPEFSLAAIKENKESLRTAIILNEILGRPISLRN